MWNRDREVIEKQAKELGLSDEQKNEMIKQSTMVINNKAISLFSYSIDEKIISIPFNLFYKIMKTKPSFIFTLISKLCNEVVAYDNPSHSDDFRQAIREAITALRNLQKFF